MKSAFTKFIIFLSLLILLTQSCALNRPVVQVSGNFREKIDSCSVAVLGFDYEGQFLSEKIAESAADRFSTDLYLDKGIKIIDRTIIKKYLSEQNIKKVSKLSLAQLQNLSRQLDAEYLVVGTISSLTSIDDYYKDKKQKFDVTVRFIEGKSGEVTAMVRHQKSGRDGVQQIINRIIKESAPAIVGKT